ncbi:hypothetical protein SAMN05444156_0310 [Verrucomicrobium sp. GAS474]|uniref:hypothetical protein n=1 Tax=Verrucomicrobium sp. GAS474 TaxID=1882831 RepID=UPI000879C185|nr:hypothetical protein [Verrucomicrobium sp. GAS474]SDT87467.1 hypothetical protein SAMN05444156_0310 [Verrucomicrobium sp. GAS474]
MWRAALLFGLYAAWIAAVSPTVYDNLSTMEARHAMVTERFLVRPSMPEAVLVGSSMSRALEKGLAESGAPEIYDLGFFGGSPLTGNALLLHGKTLPRLVVIEVNNLRQPAAEAFLQEMLGPPWGWLRLHCPALRTEYQLLRVIQSGARTLGHRIAGSPLDPPRSDVEPPTPHLEEGIAFAHRADETFQATVWKQVPKNLDRLAVQVDELRSRGVQVLFLYLPPDPRVEGSEFRTYLRGAVLARFPKAEWPWLDFPVDGSYRTTDGVHLTGPSARRASARIRERVREMLSAAPPAGR